MPTIKDIAARLGVSIGTVSKALHSAPDISESLKKTILETAVEMGYKARGNSSREDRRTVLFIENMAYEKESDFGYDIVLGFKKSAAQEHFEVTVIPVTAEYQRQNPYDALLLKNRFCGAFLLGFSLEDPWMEQLKTTSTPTVLFDNHVLHNPHVGSVGTDPFEGIDMAVEHLVQTGHEKIAFLNGSVGSLISDQRMRAYLNSMYEHHLPIDPDLAVYGYYVADAARYHVPGFLEKGATAILCGNDLIASGVIECCRQMGYRVPEDISVIGFDDIPLATTLSPPLTTVRQDRSQLGKCGLYILHAMMNGIPMSRTLLRPSLAIRESVAGAKPRLSVRRTNDPDSILNVNPALYSQFVTHKSV